VQSPGIPLTEVGGATIDGVLADKPKPVSIQIPFAEKPGVPFPWSPA
jgi:hypothetical protein